MDKNYELALYKLITEEELVSEFGWSGDNYLLAWINYRDLKEFVDKGMKTFGYSLFDDGGFDANMQSDGVCINLLELFDGYAIDFETIFPKDKYQH